MPPFRWRSKPASHVVVLAAAAHAVSRFPLTATLIRKDRQPFAAGRYVINVSIRAPYEVLRARNGRPLRGIERQSTGMVVTIQAPTSARERSAALRLLARTTFSKDKPKTIQLLISATEADPTDLTALLELGDAYIAAQRCDAAIPIFQRAIAVERTWLPPRGANFRLNSNFRLARAFVCIGNEENAIKILRDAGNRSEDVSRAIERYRNGFTQSQ